MNDETVVLTAGGHTVGKRTAMVVLQNLDRPGRRRSRRAGLSWNNHQDAAALPAWSFQLALTCVNCPGAWLYRDSGQMSRQLSPRLIRQIIKARFCSFSFLDVLVLMDVCSTRWRLSRIIG